MVGYGLAHHALSHVSHRGIVAAQINVQIAVLVVVGGRHRKSLGMRSETEFQTESSLPIVGHQQHSPLLNHG